MQLKTCQSKQTQTFNTRWRKRCEYLSVKVKVETMRQHREIKRKPVLLTKANQNQVTNRHTNTRRDWGDRWFISDRGENTGPDPCPNDPLATKHVNSDTHSLKLRETYTDWSDKEKAREKKEEKGRRAERGSAALMVISWRNCLCPQIWPRVGMSSFDRSFVRVLYRAACQWLIITEKQY